MASERAVVGVRPQHTAEADELLSSWREKRGPACHCFGGGGPLFLVERPEVMLLCARCFDRLRAFGFGPPHLAGVLAYEPPLHVDRLRPAALQWRRTRGDFVHVVTFPDHQPDGCPLCLIGAPVPHDPSHVDAPVDPEPPERLPIAGEVIRVRWRGRDWKPTTATRVRYLTSVRHGEAFARKLDGSGYDVEVAAAWRTAWELDDKWGDLRGAER